jgi:hypothetical protein
MISNSNSLCRERDAQSSPRRTTSRHLRYRAVPRANRTLKTANTHDHSANYRIHTVVPLEQSRAAAGASREVVERWLPETAIARSARLPQGNAGSPHDSENFSRRATSIWSSHYPVNWPHWFYRTGRSSTAYCSVPVRKLCSKSPAIQDTSARKLASSVCCTPGIRSSNSTRISIASFPLAGCRSITPTGSNPAKHSFFPSKCSAGCSAASSLLHLNALSKRVSCTSTEIWPCLFSQRSSPHGCDHCSERAGWSTPGGSANQQRLDTHVGMAHGYWLWIVGRRF